MPSKNRIRPQNRVRAYKTRTRTGCITCRIRHVKCDEAKPSCLKCTSTGRKCDGYLETPSSLNKSFLPLPISTSKFIGNTLEQRSFDFFCKRTVVILSGNFDPTFWTRIVLQATHHEPAIRHAVIALGALHESSEFEEGDGSSDWSNFAVQQYVKAIGSLVKPIQEKGKQAVDVALITCVLFVCFETMRGNHGIAISHIEGGVKIFSEIQPSTPKAPTWTSSATPYVHPSILNPIFIRLDRQASEMTSGRQRMLLDHILDDAVSGYHPSIPATFTSLNQARNSLENIRAYAMRFVKTFATQPDFADPVKRKMKLDVLRGSSFVRIQQWWSAFEGFVKDIDSDRFDVMAKEAIHVLVMHWTVMSVVLPIDDELHFKDPTIGDKFLPQYTSILEHGEAVIELYRRPDHPGRKRVFHLDAGIGFPLFFVAGACRNGRIRWKAIDLMRAMDRQEGLLSVKLASMVVERMVRIEEEGLIPENGEFLQAHEVPRQKRLGGMQIIWDKEWRPSGARTKDAGGVTLRYCMEGWRQVGGDGYEGGSVVREEWVDLRSLWQKGLKPSSHLPRGELARNMVETTLGLAYPLHR